MPLNGAAGSDMLALRMACAFSVSVKLSVQLELLSTPVSPLTMDALTLVGRAFLFDGCSYRPIIA